jgi:hypothetical protein
VLNSESERHKNVRPGKWSEERKRANRGLGIIIAGGSAYSRFIDFKRFRDEQGEFFHFYIIPLLESWNHSALLIRAIVMNANPEEDLEEGL